MGKKKSEALLVIYGQQRQCHTAINYSIALLDKEIYLTGKSFTYLVKLAYARLRGERDGWVNKIALEAGDNQIRYIYNLRRELDVFELGRLSEAGIPPPLVLNNRQGDYCLNLKPEHIRIIPYALLKFPDYEVVEIAQKIKAETKVNE